MSSVLWFHEIGMRDLPQVGGKNASLGEMVSHLADAGVRVPGGFATTADAYRAFLAHDGLADRIRSEVEALDIDDVAALAQVGAQVRRWIEEQPFPADLERDIRAAF
ncbi:MAG: phosphoenolpyruvate synthase, partial [Microbacterium sp.]|nr:phosphoenolpyruvate synthase [Microbacterium sp.]